MADEVLTCRVDVDPQNVLALRAHHIDCPRCGVGLLIWERCALFTALVEAFLPAYVPQTGVQAEGSPRRGGP